MPGNKNYTEIVVWDGEKIAEEAAIAANAIKRGLSELHPIRWGDVVPTELVRYVREPRQQPFVLPSNPLTLAFFGPSPRYWPYYEESQTVWKQKDPKLEIDWRLVERIPVDAVRSLYIAAYSLTIQGVANLLKLPTHQHDPRVIIFPPERFALKVMRIDTPPTRLLSDFQGLIGPRQ